MAKALTYKGNDNESYRSLSLELVCFMFEILI